MTGDIYFAYGSNMLSSQMTERCPGSVAVGTARLSGHHVAFTRFSRNWSSWAADVTSAPDADVWGVLYALTPADLALLDKREGHPTAYRRERVDVVRQDGERASVWTYIVVDKKPGKPPAFAYWRTIVDGAREHGLPAAYVALLEGLEHEESSGS